MREEARAPGGADDVAQQRLAILDRAGAQIVAVEMEEVEGKIGELLGPAQTQRLAELVDVRHTARVRHRDLAVEHHGGQPGAGERAKRLGVARIAAQQADGAAVDGRDQPVAVPLDLVRPTLAVWRLGS